MKKMVIFHGYVTMSLYQRVDLVLQYGCEKPKKVPRRKQIPTWTGPIGRRFGGQASVQLLVSMNN